jgi:proteasome lid subunit RPN8/RPN11
MKTKRLKNTKESLKEISDFCEGSLINEVCGLVGFDNEEYIFQEGKNIANDPRNNFVLDPLQYLMFKEKYKVITIFHSHLVGDEKPSDFDISMSENSCVPFSIYSLNTKKYYIHKPSKPETELDLLEKFENEVIKHNISIDD